MAATFNATSQLSGFPTDIAQFFANAASFAFIRVPERIDNILHGSGSIIAEATGNESGRINSAVLSDASSTATPSKTARGLVDVASEIAGGDATQGIGSVALHHMKSFGGFFTYMTSKWALATVVLVSLLTASSACPS